METAAANDGVFCPVFERKRKSHVQYGQLSQRHCLQLCLCVCVLQLVSGLKAGAKQTGGHEPWASDSADSQLVTFR